jgi:DNA-directed RNA polymerase subunit RPC12/RpoP
VKGFGQKVLEYPAIVDIGTDTRSFQRNGDMLWHRAILNALNEAPYRNEELIGIVKKAISLHSETHNAILTRRLVDGNLVVGGLIDEFFQKLHLAMLQNLERAGRPLDAAIGYEQLKMYDKARELREKDKQVVVRGSTVSLDLNQLLQQIKDVGIVAVYRCPRCGGKLKIDKNVSKDKLRICEYCGSEIETMDLAYFLRTALS